MKRRRRGDRVRRERRINPKFQCKKCRFDGHKNDPNNSRRFIRSPRRRAAAGTRGTSRPSAFAVRRLITSSNLVGCSTGMSAGLAPMRMRSTCPATWWNGTRMFGPYDKRPPASAFSRRWNTVGSRACCASAAILPACSINEGSAIITTPWTPPARSCAKAASNSPGTRALTT